MAKVDGRRDDETAQPASQRRGPEKVSLIIVIALALIGVIGLMVLASLGG
jgi:hypothetical protein